MLFDILSGILSDVSFGILIDILFVLSDIFSGILSGRWGRMVLIEKLRSSSAHWARRVPGWGPAVLIVLGRS